MSVYDVTLGQYFNTLSEAINASQANDVIQVPAGVYVENFPNITHNLTIQSVGGIAYLSNPQPDPPNGRAVINVPVDLNVSLTVSGLDISGAVDDASNPPQNGGANGAGILFETGNGTLLVNNCHIHNNEDGILTSGADAASINGMTVMVTNSEIDHNGVDPSNVRYGYDHNLYIGSATQFTLTNSYVHDALGGNEIQSRALASTIENNRIQDQSSGASYEISLPNGGNNLVQNNIIEKGANSPQENAASFGVGGSYPGSSLIFQDNTVINDGGAYFGDPTVLLNGSYDTNTGAPDIAYLLNNALYGIDSISNDLNAPPYDVLSGNVLLPIGDAPPLDTSSQFAVPGPPSLMPVMMAGVVYVKLSRYLRRRARHGSASAAAGTTS